MTLNGDEHDFGPVRPPEETAARRDPLASLYRDSKPPLRVRLAARVQAPPPKGARPLASVFIAAAITVAVVLVVVAVGFALHAFWDAIMLGWRIGS